jgi:hypothetical protein
VCVCACYVVLSCNSFHVLTHVVQFTHYNYKYENINETLRVGRLNVQSVPLLLQEENSVRHAATIVTDGSVSDLKHYV